MTRPQIWRDLVVAGWRDVIVAEQEVVEKALLMAYAHRHGDFPKVNKEGWDLPLVTPDMTESVLRVLKAKPADVVASARASVPLMIEALGYTSKKVYDDAGGNQPGWHGAEAKISTGFWLWIGHDAGKACHVGIWHRTGSSAWYSATIQRPTEIASALSGVLHAWHTRAGLL